jgi:hypothetical protein
MGQSRDHLKECRRYHSEEGEIQKVEQDSAQALDALHTCFTPFPIKWRDSSAPLLRCATLLPYQAPNSSA